MLYLIGLGLGWKDFSSAAKSAGTLVVFGTRPNTTEVRCYT